MTISRPLLLAAALLATTGSVAATTSRIAGLVRKLHDTSRHAPAIVIAHRTCWFGVAPENSLSGIRNCIAMGVDGIELDVVRTRDRKLVVMHDLTVDRMTEGHGKIADMTLAQAQALRLRNQQGGKNAALTDEHAPTLEAALRLARPHLLVHIHDKEPSLHEDIAKVVDHLGMKDQVMMWYDNALDTQPGAKLPLYGHVQLVSTVNECGSAYKPCVTLPLGDLGAFGKFHSVAVNINFKTYDFIRQLTASPNRPAWRIGSNSFSMDFKPMEQLQADWRAQFDAGATLMMTNHPKELLAFVKARETAR